VKERGRQHALRCALWSREEGDQGQPGVLACIRPPTPSHLTTDPSSHDPFTPPYPQSKVAAIELGYQADEMFLLKISQLREVRGARACGCCGSKGGEDTQAMGPQADR